MCFPPPQVMDMTSQLTELYEVVDPVSMEILVTEVGHYMHDFFYFIS